MKPQPLKTQAHHWWPRSLSQHWEDDDGLVSALRPGGEVTRSQHGSFGAITNAHAVKLGGPWDSTFEPQFNTADSEMTDVVSWLLTLETSHADADGPMLPRILAQELADTRAQQLARTVASLVARSPRTRNGIRLTTEHYRGEFNLPDPTASKTLIALNQRGLYDAYLKSLEGNGRWAILFSDTAEFVFGDGFWHNFPSSADGLYSLKCVLPLTPTMAVVYQRPQRYPTEPRLVTLRMSATEVASLNELVQIYAKDFIFFRGHRPTVTPAFATGQFRQLKYHRHTCLDALLDDLAQYNLWGPGGTPSRCRTEPRDFGLEAIIEKWSET